jgi:hypothetical protein
MSTEPEDIRRSVSYRLGETEAIAAVLAMAATRELNHEDGGLCPNGPNDPDRDPACIVCRALVVWDELRATTP